MLPQAHQIRHAQSSDMGVIADIWLAGSLHAHRFISADYWYKQRAPLFETYFTKCELWVLEVCNDIVGFIALHNNELSALFIRTELQNQGWGTLLLNHVKQLRESLWLAVYEKNQPSCLFYEHNGFIKQKRQRCENTKAYEYVMVWKGPSEKNS